MEYGTNVNRWLADHPDYVLRAGFGGSGYEAQRKNEDGHGVAEKYSALTLDELDAKLPDSRAWNQ